MRWHEKVEGKRAEKNKEKAMIVVKKRRGESERKRKGERVEERNKR